MKKQKIDSSQIFDAKTLNKLPLTYHYMVMEKAAEVSELNHAKKFSMSKKHQTEKYLRTDHYKPLSPSFIRD